MESSAIGCVPKRPRPTRAPELQAHRFAQARSAQGTEAPAKRKRLAPAYENHPGTRSVKLPRAIRNEIERLNGEIEGSPPIQLGVVASALAEIGLEGALQVLSDFAAEALAIDNATSWILREARHRLSAAIADETDVEVDEGELPDPVDFWSSSESADASDKLQGQPQNEHTNTDDPLTDDTEDDEVVRLPNSFVRHVEKLNSQGVFAAPLQLELCSASLSRLGQTRLMYEVLAGLPSRAYEVQNPAAWLRRGAINKYMTEGIEAPEVHVTADSHARVASMNLSGCFSIELDLGRIGFHLGRLDAEQQAVVLDRCEKQDLSLDDPNYFVIKLCHATRQVSKGKKKGKIKGSKSKNKGAGKSNKGGCKSQSKNEYSLEGKGKYRQRYE